MHQRMIPNRNRDRKEFLHYRSLIGLSLQERADFSWADTKRFFKVSLWTKSELCAGCGKKIEAFEKATLDHIIPRSMGGRTRLSNLQLMHSWCNVNKSNIIPSISGKMLAKALQPLPSRSGMATRLEMGLSVNGRGRDM